MIGGLSNRWTVCYKVATMVESEYLFGSDRKLTCKNDKLSLPFCQTCEDCVLAAKHNLTKEWFPRAGQNSQKKFLFGIIRRIQNLETLVYIERILRQVQGKDFIYSRSRMKPSLPQDSLIAHLNRALDPDKLWQFMQDVWEWFKGGSYYTKLNYTLLLMQMCSTHILHTAVNLIQVLIAQGRKSSLLKEEAFGPQDETPGVFELRSLTEPDPYDMDDPSVMVPPKSVKSTSGVKKCKDFISCLPVHLSKKILGFLNKDTLKACSSVSHHWHYLAESTLRDQKAEIVVKKEAMILQGSSNKKARRSYAKMRSVQVPKHVSDEGNIISRRGKEVQKQSGDCFHAAYVGQETATVLMEERNLYCGPYNILFVTKEPDHQRVIHYDGGRFLAVGSVDHTVKVYDIADMKPIPLLFKGHAGSVRVVHLCEEEGFLFTGGYDIGIRQWDLTSGVCVRVYNGHMKTVTCLDVHKNYLVSGSKDHLVKVWNITSGKCPRTFKHANPIFAVKINELYVVSGCEKGSVKVWHLESGTLIKTLTGHQGRIKCLSLDQWHLVSGGMDGNAIAWSTVGTFQKSLMTFWHPKEVTSVAILYLRVITSCADGKIRVFNFLSGDCLRVMRVTSRDDPVMSLCVRDNRLVINVTSSITIFEFGNICWDYSMESAHVIALKKREKFKAAGLTHMPHSYTRAQRLKIFGSSNTKVSERQENKAADQGKREEKMAGEKDEVQGVKSPSHHHHHHAPSVKSTVGTQNAGREPLPPITWLDLLNYLRSFEDLDLEPMFLKKVLSPGQKGRSTKPRTKDSDPEFLPPITWLDFEISLRSVKNTDLDSETIPSRRSVWRSPEPSTENTVTKYKTPDADLESLPLITWQDFQSYLRNFENIDLDPKTLRKALTAGRSQTMVQHSTDSWRWHTTAELGTKEASVSEKESGYDSPGPKSALSRSEKAAVERVRKRGPHSPMSPNQILLKISTIQNLQRSDELASNMEYNFSLRDSWGPPALFMENKNEALRSISTTHHTAVPSARSEPIRSSGAHGGIKTFSRPAQIRKIGTKMDAFHGSQVRSPVLQPTTNQPKTSGRSTERKRSPVAGETSDSAVEDVEDERDFCESSLPPMRALTGSEYRAAVKRPVPFISRNPFRITCGFRLLTTKQQKEYEDRKTPQDNTMEDEVIRLMDTMKARGTAHRKKIEGQERKIQELKRERVAKHPKNLKRKLGK